MTLRKTGIWRIDNFLEHSIAVNVLSAASFVAALAAFAMGRHALLPASLASTISNAAIAVTFALSGIPQLIESLVAVARLHIDTHVLMTLAIGGTAFLGMAQEGALLLLLFR